MSNSNNILRRSQSRMNIPLLLEALEPLANRNDLFANHDVTLANSLALSRIVRWNMQHFMILITNLFLEGSVEHHPKHPLLVRERSIAALTFLPEGTFSFLKFGIWIDLLVIIWNNQRPSGETVCILAREHEIYLQALISLPVIQRIIIGENVDISSKNRTGQYREKD
ncbi:hypothetical protein N7449_011725 [Penicillium cf. viridicatum]|uniref:Uncharacterized protein n=1 Tax=Penicillium cf. viridicatum TaxID=2972119 RepID=A0A9W9INZ0_9EURO|nr:hypothetical protein N7449_011725 [Penicillium cf. viridicatum]